MSLTRMLQTDWAVATPSQEAFNKAWELLVAAGVPTTQMANETTWRGPHSVIKYNSTCLRYIWSSIIPTGRRNKYASAEALFREFGIPVPTPKPTMEDVIRLVTLDQEQGCIQAQIDNLKEQITGFEYQLELNKEEQKTLKIKLNVRD